MKVGAQVRFPIETSEGWLLFYHGVLRSCNAAMSMPSARHLRGPRPAVKVLARSGPYLISPRARRTICMGDVPNVVPLRRYRTIPEAEGGRCSCADTVTDCVRLYRRDYRLHEEKFDLMKRLALLTTPSPPALAARADARRPGRSVYRTAISAIIPGRLRQQDDVGGSVQCDGFR